jgi:hypothetical protein
MSTFIRTTIAALALIGAVSAASAAPEYDDAGVETFNADTFFEELQERVGG